VGALAAPIAGGALLAVKLPLQKLPWAPALVLGVGALARAGLAVVCVPRFDGLRLDELRISEAQWRESRSSYARA
jgi:hypothetical protein